MPRKRQQTPWTEQHENGIYYVFWYDPVTRRTKRESLDTKNHAEHLQKFARFLANGGSTRYVGPAGVTVAQVLDWYDAKHVEPNVVDKTRQRDAMAHLKAYFGSTAPLTSVDKATSRAYATARRAGKTLDRVGSDSTIRRELNVLVAAANHAHGEDKKLVPATDLPVVELPPEPQTTRVPWLRKESIRLALAKADEQLLHDFILIAYYTAARRESIEYLRKRQVDLRVGIIDLQDKGDPFTKKRRPRVPIFPEIRPTIERLMDRPGEYLIGLPMYRRFVNLMTTHKITAEDLPPDKAPWPHLLRHSRASHMLMDGEDPYKVAKLLGDTLATVERVYGHFAPEYLATKSSIA